MIHEGADVFPRAATTSNAAGSADAFISAEQAAWRRSERRQWVIPRRLPVRKKDKAAGSRLRPRPTQVLAAFDLSTLAIFNIGILLSTAGRLGAHWPSETAFATAFALFADMIFLYAMGCFRKDAIVSKQNAIARLPIVVAMGAAAFFVILHFALPFAYPTERIYLSISRCVTISLVSAGASLTGLILSRYVFFAMLHRQWFRRRIMILGRGERALHLLSLMTREPYSSQVQLVVIDEGIVKRCAQPEEADALDKKADPAQQSLELLSTRLSIDEIVIASDDAHNLPFESLLACKVKGVPITSYHAFIERETGRVDLRFIDPSYLVYSNGFQMRAMDRIAKRTMDIILSLVLLSVCLPVFALAMLAIWIEGGGAIFYKQERVTRGNRVFWLYKLRTMRPDAEKDGARWAAKADSRITKVGAFLRRTRIDEIPQLLNIIRGDMSLVGPRPERPMFVDEIGREVQMFTLRHGVKTGLTGWAQINYPYGASIEDAERKLEYDLYYMKNYSWFRDISIILQTIRIIVLQEGAR
ncbi:MAG: TIGR03013 family PEP-CTERM/XrtA system glycosyltransferase [Alphaproteobacteria bacterium]|nr:TIGR03013 family PEP-CTERM/XrtA system glycosyltransferase [Alphaproteobacteria bacterium]